MKIESQLKQPFISVIVPVYKVEQYIKNCIESVQSQTFINWELILVDDGSPDKSGVICDDYSKTDNRIRVIHKENGGQARARNYAIDVCRGEYITFLDSDDFLHPEYLSYMLGVSLKYGADIVQCGFIRGNAVVFPKIEQNVTENSYDNHSVFLQGKANVIVCGKIYKRSIVEKYRIKEGKYYEDDFTTWKWYYHAEKIVVSSKILYYYTKNPTSTMAQHYKKPSFDFIEAYHERIGYFQNTSEVDMEHCSRLQLCKSLVLTFGNARLTKEERQKVKGKFEENWVVLKSSPFIGIKYKAIFFLFHSMPGTASKMAIKLHSKE